MQEKSLRAIKSLSEIGIVVGIFAMVAYGATATRESLHGQDPETATEFITNASTRFTKRDGAKVAPKRPVKRTVVKHAPLVRPSGNDKERMQTVASYINQNRRNGIKSAVYNQKTNRISIRFNRKKPTVQQRKYAKFLLHGMNAD